ncbi:hypothetical protein [Chryseolinea sp. H1M3-3]|uniref:hypothetical protein n=1 Tax=Chryseolinea sp. H1M3-3 TaxID=3034144 RepID=UPI0023EC11B0|nr:hypothetical protein [Chryseolinea sp. H1M3-3]
MSTPTPPYHFHRMKRRYQWLRGMEVLLWSLAGGLLTYVVLKLFPIPIWLPRVSGVLVICTIAIDFSRRIHLYRIRDNDLAVYLNRHYPLLQESADLLLIDDEELSSLQQLQKIKTIQRFENLYPEIKLPHYIGRAAGVFALCILLGVALTALTRKNQITEPTSGVSAQQANIDKKKLPVSIRSATILIAPPSYTGIAKTTSSDFNLQIPEGSLVEWKISFSTNVIEPQIILSAKDTLEIPQNLGDYKIMRSFNTSGFYQLTWMNPDSSIQSTDYFKIEIIKDQAPSIVVQNLGQFLELDVNDNPNIHLNATLTDDYGLQQTSIVATVSKGSGEAIKFREEKLTFDKPKNIAGKEIQATRLIDLTKMGIQPGDELYFYIEVQDTKTPSPNRSRTDTYFIALKDTSTVETSFDAGLGVDLMPEYFRSQRQIIIDSEKLLKEKKTLAKKIFNERSNSLAHDQKILRLRYGEFLGEEFESSIGPQSVIEDHESDDQDIEKKFGHAHDTENEHNLIEEKKHAHDQKESDQARKQDPSKEYVHAHDSDEEATFLTQSIRAKLKAAITIMWDAELYLRLYQPEKSLPFQYKALKLLKEISQDSRIYVHRTGFDPPPLKEEKRLTANLSEIQTSTITVHSKKSEEYSAIRAAVLEIEKILKEDSIMISADASSTFKKAGHELAAIELIQPGGYLETLSLLKKLSTGEIKNVKTRDALLQIRKSLWQVLPQKTMSPQAPTGVTHALDLEFLKNLEASKQNH